MIAKKRLLPILVAVLMVFAMMPMSAGTVCAASGDPAMSLGTEVLDQDVNTSNAQTVWYADKTWRVIGYDGNGAASESGAATLLAAGNLDQSAFDESGNDSNVYANSMLKTKVDTIAGSLTEGEQGAVKTRTLVHGNYNQDEPSNTDCIAGDADIADVLLWPLSTKEANAVNKDLRIVDPEHTGLATNYWWLRSPGLRVYYTAFVYGYGGVINDGSYVTSEYGVRPAFYLNLESGLFTSAAEGGKSSGTEGADALKAQSSLTNTGSEWKVTVKDTAHAGFKNSKTAPTEDGVSITYTGAATGTNEYISAIITDKPITEDGAAIKYYGRIAAVSDADDTVTINTTGKLGDNEHLYVFNEQYNDDKKTDYASELKEVTIPTQPETITVTFSAAGGKWTDGTTADKEVTVESGQAATPPDDPTRDGFTFDGWDTDFSNVTSALTVTAKWKENTTPSEPIKTSVPTGKTLTYNGESQTGVAADTGYTLSGTTSAANAGSYQTTATLNEGYIWSDETIEPKTISWKINKATNPLTIKAKTATVKYKKLKKKTQTLAVTKVIKFTKKLNDKKTYTLVSAKKGSKSFKKYFKINKTTGKVTIKKNKKMKKGTYKVKVKVKAAGDENYNPSDVKMLTTTIIVK